MKDYLLTAEDLAEILEVRPATIRRWVRQRRIPEIRITQKVRRFNVHDVMRALTECQPGEQDGGR